MTAHPRQLCAALLLVFFGVGLAPAAADTEEHPVDFTLIHTNDEHSSLIPHSPAIDYDPEQPQRPGDTSRGGFARLATAIEDLRSAGRRRGERVLVFSAGDFLGGPAFSWLTPAGLSAELDIMQEMGYDLTTIGNHEFDYGPEVLSSYLETAGYPEAHDELTVLGTNIEPPADHPLRSRGLLRDSRVTDIRGEVQLGAFSLIGRDAVEVASDTGSITFADRHETARRMVEELRDRGVEIVVAVTHAGIEEDRELAASVEGIDVIIGGHSHTVVSEPETVGPGDTIIVQAGSYGMYLGNLELRWHPDTGQVTTRNSQTGRPFLYEIDRSLEPDPRIEARIADYTGELNTYLSTATDGAFTDILEPVARSSGSLPLGEPLEESPVGNFVTDAMRLATAERLGTRVDVALQANGSLRAAMQTGTRPGVNGLLSVYDITDVVGLGYGPDGRAGYPIVSFYVTGDELRQTLELAVLLEEILGDTYFLQFSGLRYSYDARNAVLLTLPFIDTPVPTTRAVRSAALYAGAGIQPPASEWSAAETIPLRRGDDRLYHVVTDSYILSFLPEVGELVPGLDIRPKRADGTELPVERFEELIVRREEGGELKVWQAVLEYAAGGAQTASEGGDLPTIPPYYREPAGRIVREGTIPYIAYLWSALIVVAGGLTALLLRRRRRRSRQR